MSLILPNVIAFYNFRTTPSMPRLGETPYFPMQAGPKGLRGV